MRVSFEWLKEYVNISDSAQVVGKNLTMAGLEVEAIEIIEDDCIFEINVTPNRSDCLSIVGIAREISAIYNIPINLPGFNILSETKDLGFDVDILDTNLCHRYAGRIIRDVTVKPSPHWIRKRLERCGIRAINNIVDATNYALLELGHPLHAFDLDKLEGSTVKIGTPLTITGGDSQVIIKTIDEVERLVSRDTLLIWDEKEPVAIAGIMGGYNSAVIDSTKNIFIESAYFNPISIRRSSKTLGLKTESSYRFERGSDIKILKKALDRTALIIKNIAGGEISGKIDIYPKRHFVPKIKVKFQKVNSVLGLDLSKELILDCIKRLDMEVILLEDERFIVRPQTYRQDIQTEIDIIEEIARIYGFDNIPSVLPKAVIGYYQSKNTLFKDKIPLKDTIKNSFLNAGYTEVINYSFINDKDINLLKIDRKDIRKRLLQIKNPLKEEDSFMRTTLISGLLKNLDYNLSLGNRSIKIFEMARVFINNNPSELPEEIEHFGALLYREKEKSLYKDDTMDFYTFKGVLETILNNLNIDNYYFVRSIEPFLHPEQSSDIYIGNKDPRGKRIGCLGVIHPTIAMELDIKTSQYSLLIMELDINEMLSYPFKEIKFKPLSKYPSIQRDTAIIVDKSISYADIMKYLKIYQANLIENVYIFDIYQGKNIPEGKKGVAFNICYRSKEKTLTVEEVETAHNLLIQYILDKTKGQLRV